MKADAFEAYNKESKYSEGFHMQKILIAGGLGINLGSLALTFLFLRLLLHFPQSLYY